MVSRFDIQDLQGLYQRFFGITPAIKVAALEQSANTSTNAKLGSTYYLIDEKGRTHFMPVKLNGNYLPYPLIRINGRKSIIETSLVGREGTVKELINIDDYKISIRGLCVGDNGMWPEDQVTQLRDLYVINSSIPISCPLTDIFLVKPDRSGSDHVVITNFEIMETKGFKGIVPYQMDLISDGNFDLIIK